MKSDAIYNLSFRFQNINLNNINDIYFAINIIIIIATTLFETLIVIIFIFKLIIIIVIVVIEIFVIIIFIIVSEKLIFKFIAFDFDIKRRLAINILDRYKNNV